MATRPIKTVSIDTHRLWLSQKEAQKYLGVSKDWIKARRENGELHYAVVGNTAFYIKSEIDNLIRSNAITGYGEFYRTR